MNQVVLQLICERQAGIPLLMQTLNGNNSDKESFREMVTDFTEQMDSDFSIEYLVADSALYTADTLSSMNHLLWISRVPETLNLAREIIDMTAPEWIHTPEQPAFRALGVNYGEVRQRWVVVFSPEAYQRAQKTINKQCGKQSLAELRAFTKLCKQNFACDADARQALTQFETTLKLNTLSEVEINAIPRFKGKGRPAQGRQPDYFDYRIEGAMAVDLQERTRRLQRKSCFILASNQLDDQALPHEELIAAYKDQQKVERGFRFLKDPMFMASTLFLESPKRIMALMMVMTLSLMVYAALEHRIRERLAACDETFPNQKGKLINNPSARWVFQYFSGITLLVIAETQELVLNLNEYHIALVNMLGERYSKLYSGSG
ncbi:IS1634 family transposase [Ectothiorhodospiraceae bacterium BW-2]|nr:IS1634 family transposase [Ectothiorhodospiraceae bacterium BW-2]